MEIVKFPHPALRWKSKPVTEITPSLVTKIQEMFQLMYAANGIGLAANQVAWPFRVFILNLSGEAENKEEELVFINPEIIRRKGTTEGEEGCLSFPGLFAPVKRADLIKIEAYNLDGECIEYDLDELAARAVQHENDHLDGVLFIDRMADSVRREHTAAITDFENSFRKQQAAGEIVPDEFLKQQLMDLERQGL